MMQLCSQRASVVPATASPTLRHFQLGKLCLPRQQSSLSPPVVASHSAMANHTTMSACLCLARGLSKQYSTWLPAPWMVSHPIPSRSTIWSSWLCRAPLPALQIRPSWAQASSLGRVGIAKFQPPSPP